MEKEGKNIWLKCLSLIQKQVLPEKFKTLFEPIRAVRFKDDVLTIQVASAYVYEVLEECFESGNRPQCKIGLFGCGGEK